MAATNKYNTLAAQVIDSDTTTNGTTLQLPAWATNVWLESIVSARTDGTFTAKLQHSPDGTNWFDNGTATAQSTDSTQVKAATANGLMYVRAVVTSASTTDGATVQLNIWYGDNKEN